MHVHIPFLCALFCIFIDTNGSSTVNVVVMGRHGARMKRALSRFSFCIPREQLEQSSISSSVSKRARQVLHHGDVRHIQLQTVVDFKVLI